VVKIIQFCQILLSLITVMIEIVEEPGNGPLKRHRAINLVQDAIQHLPLEQRLAPWIMKALTSTKLIGWIIDMIVDARNKEKIQLVPAHD